MNDSSFDVAVIGLGTMGTFACLWLARRGASVVGLDSFAPPHNRGSHSGDTRIYREAYTESPEYVPLAQRAGRLWDDLGRETGATLLHRSGMLSIGEEFSRFIAGIQVSAVRHGLVLDRLSAADIQAKYPGLRPRAGNIGLFEPAAGWIDVNSALTRSIDLARRIGADIRLNSRVEEWSRDGSGFTIRTSQKTIHADRIIIAAGAWASSVLRDVGVPLRVVRKTFIWVDPLAPELFSAANFPVFAFADQFFYGFPPLLGKGVKLAIHLDEHAEMAAPDPPQRAVERSEIEPVLARASKYMPALAGDLPGAFDRVSATGTCLYTMTPDEHFVIDRHPAHENVWFAAGFSGHGFKFAPAIGEALAELAIFGETEVPVGFLKIGSRFV